MPRLLSLLRHHGPTLAWSLVMVLAIAGAAWAAVSCSLNDPDRDVKKAFPTSTGYRTEFHSILREGGHSYHASFEQLYGRKLDTYAEVDIEHAFYPVLKNRELIGYLFGATQKGKYGTLQVIAVTDPKGVITSIYYQMLSAPYSAKLKAPEFLKQFVGLKLDDFKGWKTDDTYSGKLTTIKSPVPEAAKDTEETLWGLKKVLMLFDHYYQSDATLKTWPKGA